MEPGAENGFVEEPEEDIVRAFYEGGFVFYNCPSDHEALDARKKQEKKKKGRKKRNKSQEDTEDTHEEEEMILMSCCFTQDFYMKLVPQPLINFILKVAVSTAWNMFLGVAMDVKDGKRPDHVSAIEEKRTSFYDWIDERIGYMFNKSSSSSEIGN